MLAISFLCSWLNFTPVFEIQRRQTWAPILESLIVKPVSITGFVWSLPFAKIVNQVVNLILLILAYSLVYVLSAFSKTYCVQSIRFNFNTCWELCSISEFLNVQIIAFQWFEFINELLNSTFKNTMMFLSKNNQSTKTKVYALLKVVIKPPLPKRRYTDHYHEQFRQNPGYDNLKKWSRVGFGFLTFFLFSTLSHYVYCLL
jgi:hypothetical protein